MKNDVLGFDIPVDDSKTVDLIDCLTDLAHDEGDAGLGERLSLFQLVV